MRLDGSDIERRRGGGAGGGGRGRGGVLGEHRRAGEGDRCGGEEERFSGEVQSGGDGHSCQARILLSDIPRLRIETLGDLAEVPGVKTLRFVAAGVPGLKPRPISEARTRAGCRAGGCVFGRGGDVNPYGEPPMKMLRPNCPLWLTAVALVALAALPSLLRAQSADASPQRASSPGTPSAPVTITDN